MRTDFGWCVFLILLGKNPERMIFMKRIIATILVTLMLMSTAYATATFENISGKIGELNIDNSVQGKVTSYLYNGGTYSFTVNDKDFETLNNLFSDQNLTNSLKSFNEPLTGSMSDYPKGGKYIVKELYDNENKCSITLEFSFDSNGVLLSEIVINSDAVNHILRQGYYTYKSKDIYNQIKDILDGYAKIEEEKTINDKYELKANELKISDLKILYTATFSDSKFSVNGDNKWTWGICSYKYDKGETVTKAYLSLLEDNKGTKYFIVSDIGLQKNNTIYFSGNTDVLFYGNENFGKENTKSEILYSYKLQFNISDDLEIEDLVYSQTHKHTNVPQTINIDMNKYVGDKTLPKLSAFQFSSANNLIQPEEKDEIIKVNGTNLDDVLDKLVDSIEQMEFGSSVELGAKDTDEDFIATYIWQNGCSADDVCKFAEGLFSELKAQATTGKPTSAQSVSYCTFSLTRVENLKTIHHQVKISVWDDGVKIAVNRDDALEFKVKNSDAIINYIKKHSNNNFSGFSYEKNDENTPSIKGSIEGLTKTDIIEFKFVLPADTDNDISKEVASSGSTVSGTFERYKETKYKSTYILTLSGNLGTVSLCEQTQSSLGGEEELFSYNFPVSFMSTKRYENENIVEYKAGKNQTFYKFKMVFNSNDIEKAYFEDTPCFDLKYTQLTEDTKLADEFVEKDKEVILRKAQECADTLYDFGLFKGTDNGYELEKSLTREESATILVRLLGEEDKVDADDFEKVFVDVDKNRWSYAYVMYCYENDITKGTGADTFSPDVQIDANQFITLMMRLLGYSDVEPDTALQKSVEYKLLPQEKIDELTNKKVFTRSDMVQIVYNSLKTQMDDETIFADYLLEKGILTEKEIEQIK